MVPLIEGPLFRSPLYLHVCFNFFNLVSGIPGVHWRDPDLHEVIEFLSNPNSVIKANAAAYLQHLCYMDDPVCTFKYSLAPNIYTGISITDYSDHSVTEHVRYSDGLK
jgi:hypothetical protein